MKKIKLILIVMVLLAIFIVNKSLQNEKFDPQRITLYGAINNPGVFELSPGENLAYAIQKAGLKKNSDLTGINLLENKSGTYYIPFNKASFKTSTENKKTYPYKKSTNYTEKWSENKQHSTKDRNINNDWNYPVKKSYTTGKNLSYNTPRFTKYYGTNSISHLSELNEKNKTYKNDFDKYKQNDIRKIDKYTGTNLSYTRNNNKAKEEISSVQEHQKNNLHQDLEYRNIFHDKNNKKINNISENKIEDKNVDTTYRDNRKDLNEKEIPIDRKISSNEEKVSKNNIINLKENENSKIYTNHKNINKQESKYINHNEKVNENISKGVNNLYSKDFPEFNFRNQLVRLII